MSDEVILSELRGLRRDLGSMNERVVSMRYEDLKGVFVMEMREALSLEGNKVIRSDLDNVQVVSSCSLRSGCMDKLRVLVDAVTKAMERDDLQTAHELLDRTDDLICGETSPCLDKECSRSASGTINRARLMLDLYSGLLNKFATSSVSISATNQGEDFDPSEAERALGPLANAHRLTIMDLLSSGGRPLSEIGKCLEMPTGHLQFHMRALREADYVSSDRRSRIYSLTPKGTKALGAVRELVGKASLK
ncbi:MAG: helix-turn-helix domain-containing protein [Methanomassiliicoccales archaeon]|nr:helix-turn-helix domain-containing protein [Methanomassiliicoccales archaeon]